MDDITKKPEFGQILQDAANYRTLKDLIRVLDNRSQDSGDRTVIPASRTTNTTNKRN
jgi:hypothetical protein